ncbi:MAG: hypothetical protein ACPIOQ_31135 [Promethearchaeia archaeon]
MGSEAASSCPECKSKDQNNVFISLSRRRPCILRGPPPSLNLTDFDAGFDGEQSGGEGAVEETRLKYLEPFRATAPRGNRAGPQSAATSGWKRHAS